ncbi:FACT complex subunit SSRP1-like isoform X3 [Oncorhynchus masou masou]|uniref:FACT complex subunit SSRP1-like isoform X3 n=1 Tax=Oncorhynchus masou masou TaxID=90313 RepID=UPI0031833D92
MGDPLEVSDIYQEVKWVFRDSVLSKADVIQATRDAVCIFKELQCLTPRGREKRYGGKLSKNMSGSLYEMVSRVMKALVNRKITVPGNFLGPSV